MSATVVREHRPAVSVDELARAWDAVQSGAYRAPDKRHLRDERRRPVGSLWSPPASERVLPVVGCVDNALASTVALALATAAPGRARVIECGTPRATGLTAASTAELGVNESGWVCGTRGADVLIERTSDVMSAVDEVPQPSSQGGVALTVLDVGWDLSQLLATDSWLRTRVSTATTVVVTTATVPGLRQLDTVLNQLVAVPDVVAVVVGPSPRKWPKPVRRSVGPGVDALVSRGGLVTVPDDRRLALFGVDSSPLPRRLVLGAAQVLRLVEGTA